MNVTRGQRRHLVRLLAQIETRPELAGDGDLVIDTLALLLDS